jgi:glycosyltransferase involved in cell wall biosynthesis
VIFCGVLDYEPNVEASVWLGRSVWPVVRRSRPDARLLIVGAQPVPVVQRLHDADSGIEVLADVPDVRPHLWRAAVSAAPLQTARGVQNKVLEAVAAGLPAVVTPVVMEGLPEEVRRACVEAAEPSGFAGALLRLLAEPPAARRARAEAADLGALSWERRLAPLRALVEAAAARQKSV